MLDKKTILETSLMLICIGLVLFAYRLENWVLYDFGWLAIALYAIVSSYKNVIKSIVAWLFFSLVLNSLITSLFFDVTIFGLNQKIYIAIMLCFAFGLIYKQYKKDKDKKERDLKCKRDFTKMYKSVITDVNRMKAREQELNNILREHNLIF